jgi:hypothetical protein
MQFIPLSVFFDFLDAGVQVIPPDRQGEWEFRVHAQYDSGKQLKVGANVLDRDAMLAYLKKLSHPAILVFDQWITQSKNLQQLLLAQQLGPNDFHQHTPRDHQLFPAFSDFITPMLLPVLLRQQDVPSAKDLAAVFTYLYLLDSDARIAVQHRGNDWLDVQLAALQQSLQKIRTEKELAQVVMPLLSADFIGFVNGFEKAFYASRMKYTNALLDVLQSPACSARLGHWLVAQLKELNVNAAHREKIAEVQRDIRKGRRSFRNQAGRIRNGINATFVVRVSIFLILLLGIWYVVRYNPWGETEDTRDFSGNKTSFQQFSVAERQQMDSLIQAIENEQRGGPERSDPYNSLAPSDLELSQRVAFRNEKAELFYRDCLKDESLQGLGFIDTCITYSPEKLKGQVFPDFGDLRKKSGKRQVSLQNTTDYQVIVLIFEDVPGAKMAAAVLAAGETLKFKINPGESCLFLPGRDFGAFEAATTVASSLPSPNYKHHFCFRDNQFTKMLGKPFRFKTTFAGTVHLELQKPDGDDFRVSDENQALDEGI